MSNDKPTVKQIKIRANVCDKLDNLKGVNDSYTDTIENLLKENLMQKERIKELEKDKQDLIDIMKLSLTTDNKTMSNEGHKAIKQLQTSRQ